MEYDVSRTRIPDNEKKIIKIEVKKCTTNYYRNIPRTHTGKASRYFHADIRDQLIINGIHNALTIPFFKGEKKGVNNVKAFFVNIHISQTFEEAYEKSVRTNSNLIKNTEDVIQAQLTTISEYSIIETRYYETDNFDMMDSGINEALIEDLDTNLNETQRK